MWSPRPDLFDVGYEIWFCFAHNNTDMFILHADSSFVPPLIYAVFGNSRHLAVGTVASSSLIIAEAIEKKVHEADDPQLYLNLIFTATLISGVIQLILGIFR